MLESFPALGFCAYATLQSFASGSNAVSPEAQQVSKAATAVVKSTESSQALFGGKALALSQLWELVKEHEVRSLDGAESYPINQLALFNVTRFLRALPDRFQLPEFAAEPDGSISLDWIQSKARLFSLSVGPTDRLAYAWVDGSDKGHGVAHFDAKNVPIRILQGIEGILNHGNSSIRAA